MYGTKANVQNHMVRRRIPEQVINFNKVCFRPILYAKHYLAIHAAPEVVGRLLGSVMQQLQVFHKQSGHSLVGVRDNLQGTGEGRAEKGRIVGLARTVHVRI